MFNIELLTEVFGHPENGRLKLPDRMVQPGTSSKVWNNVFGNRRKLKEAADGLSRSRVLSAIPRKVARTLDPELIVAGLLISCASRYNVFEEHLPFDYRTWVSLMGAVHNRVVKKLPPAPPSLDHLSLDLGKYDLQMDESKSRDPFYLQALAHYAVEVGYTDLNSDDKDLADFFVNTALCEINDSSFIVDFLDKFPWLKHRNTKLYEGALEEVQENEAEYEEFDFTDFLADCASRLNGMAMADRSGQLKTLVSVARLADDLINNDNLGLRQELYTRVNMEKDRLLEFVEDSINQSTAISTLKNIPSWVSSRDLVSQLQEPIQVPWLGAGSFQAIADYCARCDKHRETMQEFPERFIDSLKSYRRLKAEVAEETSKDDMSIDTLIAKSAELKVADAVLSETSEQAGQVFLSLLTGMIDFKKSLEESEDQTLALTLQAPVLGLSAPMAEPEPEALVPKEAGVDAVALEQLSVDLKALHGKLDAAQAQAVELDELNTSLMNQIDTLKHENHVLKQRVVYEPQKEVNIEPIDVTNNTLIALITQNRTPNPEEILKMFEAMAPDRLEVLPSAIQSAQEADNFGLPYRLCDFLYKLIFDYLDMIKSGNPDAEARKIFGQNYSAKESEGVTSSKRLRAMREFYYGGETVLFLQHLSVGRNYGTQKSIRVYFKIIEGRVVIAHCGAHLETMTTN